MPPAARWIGLALGVVLVALAIDGLKAGEAWSRTGRDTSRREQPVSYWLSIACQLAVAGLCLWCSATAWTQPA